MDGMREQAFLGVTCSFSGRYWQSRLDGRGEAHALAMVQRYGISDVLARVLVGRDVAVEDVAHYIQPALRDLLPDPDTLTAMPDAVTRLMAAIENREKIAIFGDYDVDGATSSALLAEFLRQTGCDPQVYIPDRITDGYGPNQAIIEEFARANITLLITVDCGSTSFEALEIARRCKMDVVVIDHHQVNETLPHAVAVVNPNRLDDLSGLEHLAAVGVVFMLLVALNRALRQQHFWNGNRPEPDLRKGLDLVAMGTVADVVPLKGLNRAFVTQGLKIMAQRQRPGLRALADVARMDGPPTPYHLGFLLGPRINAGGRIGQAELGCRLLMEYDDLKLAEWAQELERLNSERQFIEKQTLEDAENRINPDPQSGIIVAAAEDWHPGIVGLVASRLKEKYRMPVFAIAINPHNGMGTGSGRSVAGVDLGGAVRAAVEAGILVKGGGHAMAAGLTVEVSKIPDFQLFMKEKLAQQVVTAYANNTITIDGKITASGITPEMITILSHAGPFGSGNPEPLFALPAHQLIRVDPVGANHLRIQLKANDGAVVRGIAFRAAGQPLGDSLLGARGQAIHVLAHLHIDRWGGGERAEIRVIDAAFPQGVIC